MNTRSAIGEHQTRAYTRVDVLMPMKTKVRDIPPTAVRLSPELRHALAREAEINGRSLHAEIVRRLQQSLEAPAQPYARGVREPSYATDMTDGERRLVTLFKKLSPEKQLALLSLLT